MLIDPKIIKIESKNLIGMSVITTPSDQEATGQLWKSFMPYRNKIKNVSNDNLYSVQIFPKHTNFKDFNAETPFQKWAAVEVNEIESIPEGMKALNLPKGEYAIFSFATKEGMIAHITLFWAKEDSYAVEIAEKIIASIEMKSDEQANTEQESQN